MDCIVGWVGDSFESDVRHSLHFELIAHNYGLSIPNTPLGG